MRITGRASGLKNIGVCLLVMGIVLPSFAMAENNPPTLPASLQGVRYSETAGEIYWSPATDESTIVGYRVSRNDETLGIRDARSVFEPDLLPGQAYRYTVNAVDQFGNEGAALSVEVPASIGAQAQGRPVLANAVDAGSSESPPDPSLELSSAPSLPLSPDPSPEQVPADDQPVTPVFAQIPSPAVNVNSDEIELSVSKTRTTLSEGDESGASITVSVVRNTDSTRVITLSLESAEDRDWLNIRHDFSTSTLVANQSSSVLNIKLDVGIAPLLHHERRFTLVADDGVLRTSTEIVLDITPIAAPDVYLLLGQSNMEGYSELDSRQRFAGGLDERHDRIKQLNVQPNSRTVFSDDSLFTDEVSNVSTPLFVPAEDPLHEPRFMGIDGKEASFVGLGLTFAKSALTMSTAEIVLVPAAWGASGFCANDNAELAWNAEPTPYRSFLGGTLLADRAMTRLNLALRESGGILRGILWHQGGADSNNESCAQTYAQNLAKLAARIRTEALQDRRGGEARGYSAVIPFIVGTQSKGDDERARFSEFNRYKQEVDISQRLVGNYILHSEFVNNDDLVPPQYPCGQVSCVHFGATAMREQGRRFYRAVQDVWTRAGAYHY